MNKINTGFDSASLERRYAFLDDCPAKFFQEAVTLPIGSLPERVAGIRRWRDALLDGRLPPAGFWPPDEIAGPIRRALEEMNIARFCKGQPDLVDSLMKDILGSMASQAKEFQAEVSRRLLELENLERERLSEREQALAKKENREARATQIDERTMFRLMEEAKRAAAGKDREADDGLIGAWAERARAWAEIASVFGDLGLLLGRGWDYSFGVLRHTGWEDLLRLKNMIEKLPQLREIIRSLGRMRVSEGEDSVVERIFEPVRRLEEERRQVTTPLVFAETRGVERSGEIARMLPVEASMLGHPRLKLLWHAKRAERALLTYRVEGIEIERTLREIEHMQETEKRRPRPERGPVIAVVDTSGSMQGLPERVAKAIVLEAMRTAHAEKRPCYLYAYSGPGQILSMQLDLSSDGIGRLLEFLAFSFGGGNDETGLMQRVVSVIKEKEWEKADVLFVSDGEWPTPPELRQLVSEAKEKRVRFHGVQIGNIGSTGLHDVCDPVHVFRDWADAEGWR